MSGTQEMMFDEDKKHEELKRLEVQLRHKSEELKADLKKCSGYMSLLKDGPKNVTEILFRCQQTDLAANTLTLLAQQAQELSESFTDCMKKSRFIAECEETIAELRTELKVEERTTGTVDEEDLDADVPEDDFDDAGSDEMDEQQVSST